NPEVAAGHTFLGTVLTIAGRFDEADAAVRQAMSLEPGVPTPENVRRALFVLTERWSDAESIDRRLSQSSDSSFRVIGSANLALDAAYRGHLSAALHQFEQAASLDGPRGSNLTANVRNLLAAALLEADRPAVALSEAQRAFAEARDQGAEWLSLFLT